MTRVAVVDQDSVLALNADGTRLAYTDLDDGRHELYRYDQGSATSTPITGDADGDTTAVAIDGDGTTIAFVSDATDLDAEGAPLASGIPQAYLAQLDGDGATLTRLPLPDGDTTGAGEIAISKDGSRVAFGDGGTVYLWRSGQPLTTVDVAPAGSTQPLVHRVTLSADGSTLAAVVGRGAGAGAVVVVADLKNGTSVTMAGTVDPRSPAALTGDGGRVTAAPVGQPYLLSWHWRVAGAEPFEDQHWGSSVSGYPSVSADGEFVADSQKMSDEDGYLVHVGVPGGGVYASVDDSNRYTPTSGFGTDATLAQSRPQLSADGLTVAFRSNAQLAGQSGAAPTGQTVIYLARLHDEQAPTFDTGPEVLAVDDVQATSVALELPDPDDDLAVVRVEVTDNGAPATDSGADPDYFTVGGLEPGTKHVFAVTAYDESGHPSEPESVTAWTPNTPAAGHFTSAAVSGAPDGTSDVNVDDLASAPAISAHGRYVAYVGAPIASYAAGTGDPLDAAGHDLTDPATLSSDDEVYLTDTLTGETTLVTQAADSTNPAASPAPYSLTISADGRYVGYVATGTDLAPGVTGSGPHVYVYDRESGASGYAAAPNAVLTLDEDNDVPVLHMSDDGSRLLVLTDNGSGYMSKVACVLDWKTGAVWEVGDEDAELVSFTGSALSGDGKTVAIAGSDTDMRIASIYDVPSRTEIDSLVDAGAPVGLSDDGTVLRLDRSRYRGEGDENSQSAEWDRAHPDSLTYFAGPELVAAAADGVHAALYAYDEDQRSEQVYLATRPGGVPATVGEGWAPAVDADGSAIAYVDIVGTEAGYHSAVFVARPPDGSAPTWDSGTLRASDETTTSLHLSWPAATDNVGVASYTLTRDGKPLATLPGATTEYDVSGLAAGTSYTFAVVAQDAAGNASPSLPVTVSTLSAGVTPGDDPLIAQAQPGGLVSLSWDPAAGTPAGYRILRDDGSGLTKVVDVGPDANTYTDSGRLASTGYTYRVDVLDADGTAGPWTTAASVDMPAIVIDQAIATMPFLSGSTVVALGDQIRLRVTGEQHRQASARIDYAKRTRPAGPPTALTATVPLTADLDQPGTYTGAWTIPDGAAHITAVTGLLSDGVATHDATAAAAGLPVEVSGALAITVDAPPTGSLDGSELDISGPGYETTVSVDAPGLFAVPVPAGSGYDARLETSGYAVLGQVTRDVDAGLTTAVELHPTFDATLEVTLAKADGTTGGTTVTVTDAAGHPLGQQDVPVGTSTATFTGLAAGTDVTVTSTLDDEAEALVLQPHRELYLVGGENDVSLTHKALPTGTIAGTVTSSDAGRPVAGASVHVRVESADGRDWAYDTTTDGAGHYQALSVAGVGTIAFSADGYFAAAATAITVGSGETVTRDGQLERRASLTVHVVPPTGGSAGGVTVKLADSAGQDVATVRVPDGQVDATFPDLHLGAQFGVTVRVDDDSRMVQLRYASSVTLDSYDETVTVQERALSTATLTGTISADDGSGAIAPLGDVAMYAVSADGRDWDAEPDTEGHYTLVVPAGAVTLVISPGDWYHPASETTTYTLAPDETVTHDAVFVRPELTVHVESAPGIAAGGVSVGAGWNEGPNWKTKAQTIPDGQTSTTLTNLGWGEPVTVWADVLGPDKPVQRRYTTTVTLTKQHNTLTITEKKLMADGVTLTSGTVGSTNDGRPVFYWEQRAAMTMAGCPGGITATSIVGKTGDRTGDFGDWPYQTYLMSPTSAGSSTFTGTLPAQYPMHGPSELTTSTACAPGSLMTPTSGPAGTAVNLAGSRLSDVTGVDFGGVPAASFTGSGDGLVQAVAPTGSGTVEVTVQTAAGVVDAGSFSYGAAAGAGEPEFGVARGPRAAVATAATRAATATLSPQMQLRPFFSVTTVLDFLFQHARQLLAGGNLVANLHTVIDQALKAVDNPCSLTRSELVSLVKLAAAPALKLAAEALIPGAEELVLAASWETGLFSLVLLAITPLAVQYLVNKLAGMVIGAAVDALYSSLGCNGYPKPDILIDPSGTVLDTNGNPVDDAKVTILRADTAAGPFTAVDETQPGIEPAVNPEITAGDGGFHWDVRSGYYEIQAAKPGCTDPDDATSSTATTVPYPVPPPQTGLVVTLKCPGEPAPPVPTVTGLSTTTGPVTGGTSLIVTGSGFTPAATVSIGPAAAKTTFLSPDALSISTPAGAPGWADATVHTTGGDSTPSSADRFFYGAAPTITGLSVEHGSISGGTTLTLTGTGFTGATAVGFGGTPGTDLTVVSDTQLRVTTPAHTAGAVPVVVVNPAGASSGDAAGSFTFQSRPRVTLSVDTSPTAPRYGQPVTLSVATDPVRSGATITVTEGKTVLGSATTTTAGTAAITLTGMDVGTHTLTVSYAGDADSLPATTQTRVTVRAAGANPGPATNTVGAGGTAYSAGKGTKPSAANPVIAAVTTPNAGAITFTPFDPGSGASPVGYSLLSPGFLIGAPTGSVGAPLVLTFQVDDASRPAGVTSSDLTLFRDGTAVPACASPTVPTTEAADPDPCVRSVTDSDGITTITARSSHASAWVIGAPSTLRPSRLKLDGVRGVHPGGTERVAVRVWNSDGSFAAHVVVRFTVTGADRASGTVTTDARGFGNFTYTPTGLGPDRVRAAIGTLHRTTTVRIIAPAQHPVLSARSRTAGTIDIAAQTRPRVTGRKVRAYVMYRRNGTVHWLHAGYAIADTRGRAHKVLTGYLSWRGKRFIAFEPGHHYTLAARMAGRDYREHLSNRFPVTVGS